MTAAGELREHLEAPGLVQAPGAYDGLTAKLVERAGYPAVYMTGYGTAASHGKPDTGILGLEEMCANARTIAEAVGIPVIADADTGYADVQETIARYEAAGVAALHLEDQTWPKKCGHMDGKTLVSCGEMVEKILAAVAARRDSDTVLIARTDAIAVEGFDEALERAAAYADAGADLLFVESPLSLEQAAAIPKALPSKPHLYNIAPKSPSISKADLEELGYALAIYPGVCFTSTMLACQAALADLGSAGEQANLVDWKREFEGWNALLAKGTEQDSEEVE